MKRLIKLFIFTVIIGSCFTFYSCETKAERERRERRQAEMRASIRNFEFLIHHPNSTERVMFRGIDYRITSKRGTNRLIIREYNSTRDISNNRIVLRTTATIQSLN